MNIAHRAWLTGALLAALLCTGCKEEKALPDPASPPRPEVGLREGAKTP